MEHTGELYNCIIGVHMSVVITSLSKANIKVLSMLQIMYYYITAQADLITLLLISMYLDTP